MKKTRKITNKTCLKLAAFLFFPCALFGGVAVANQNQTHAAEIEYSYSEGYRESCNVTNPSFVDGSKPFASGNTLSGWTAIESTSAKGMIIDVGSKVESDDPEVENTTFAQNKETYILETNPETKDSDDTRILMINSKSDSKKSNVETRKGYKSSTISLAANSYYGFYVSAKTMKNGDAYAEASIYLDGLKDKDGKKVELAFEKIKPTTWGDYYFFVATGDEPAQVTLQLYLGSKSSDSSGVAFFDATSISRYSENEFYELCTIHGYNGNDTSVEKANGKAAFLINTLASEKNIVDDISTYNFNFESAGVNLEENWEVISHPNGEARIINYADFTSETGLAKIGNDLSYKNERGLLLQTTQPTSTEYSSSYVGIKSKDISIMPHASYRVSLKLKIAQMESGTFYLKVSENDYIYSVYTEEISNDKEADNYLALGEGQTSGYNTNVTNAWTNDYQTIDFFVKGHSLYYSSVNIELWLGSSETSAVGCVLVDDINVEMVSDDEVDTSDCLTLNSGAPSTTISNASFNTATSESDSMKYPLTASNWTVTSENDINCEAGVVYLDGRTMEGASDSVYNKMYSKADYDWAGINPGNSDGSLTPSNVYMMYNRENSYQTLQSPAFDLTGQEYYKLSFNYFNQAHSSGTKNPSEIKVEVIDSNGIVLFSQDKISSNETWATMNIYLRSTSAKTHNVNVKIYLGEKDAKVGGYVYIDNLNWTTATAEEYESSTAVYKTDMTGFYTKLDMAVSNTNKVVSSSAYAFSAEVIDNQNFSSSNCGFGGIVRGIDNAYGIENENDNFLALTTHGASTISLKSNFTLNFDANAYYKLTFSLATLLGEGENTDEHECSYGVTIKLEGYGEIANLITDGSLKDYTIYFKAPDTSTTPALQFILTSDCDATTGSALLTNLALETADEDKYTAVQLSQSYGDSVFTSEYAPDAEPDEEEPEDTTTEDETNADSSTAWILVPSIITALAIIVAVVGYAMRKVKIKKIEKVQSATYDKRINENHELVMAQAQKVRDEEVANLRLAKKAIENDKATLEENHKEFIRTQREKDKGKISRTAEKAFKQYTAKMSMMNEKIKIIDEKIAYAMTADHLIEVERKLIAKADEKKPSKKIEDTNQD